MKSFARLLTFIVCFEMILGSHGPQILRSSTALAESCPKGQVYNGSLNRCLTSTQVSSVNRAVEACKNISDAQAKKDCFKKNAQDALAASGAAGDVGMKGVKVGAAAAIAVPLFFLIKAMTQGNGLKSCKPASLVLMYSGGAALLVGEITSFIMHQSNLSKNRKRLRELQINDNGPNADVNRANATEIQSESFELLAKNEDSIAKVAKTKFTAYMIATGLFASGAIMAVIEKIRLGKAIAQGPSGQATVDQILCNKATAPNTQAASTPAGTSAVAPQGGDSLLGGVGKQVVGGAASSVVTGALQGNKSNDGGGNANVNQNPSTNPKLKDENGCQIGKEVWNDVDGCVKIDSNNSGNFRPDLKIKAIKNIASVKDLNQLTESLAELNAIEYEPFSRFSYFEGNGILETPKLAFSSLVAKIISESLLVSDASAQTGGTFQYGLDNKMPSGATYNPNGRFVKPFTPVADSVGYNSNLVSSSPMTAIDNSIRTGANGGTVANSEKEVTGILNKAVYTPTGRLITNGLLGTWMGIMSGHMKKQQKDSEERAEMLRKMKEEFVLNNGLESCTPQDRSNPSNSSCYCYTPEGKRNSARGSSKVCATLWGTLPKGSVAGDGSDDTKVCVTQYFSADPSCSCRTQIGADGRNKCLKASSGYNIPGIDTGTFKMLNAATAPANSLYSGAGAGTMDAAGIGANAMRIKAVADKMIEKDKDAGKQISQMEKGLIASSKGLSLGGDSGSRSDLAGMTPQAAARELEKELEKAGQEITKSGSSQTIGGGSDASGEKLDFGLTQDNLSIQEDQIAEVMNKDLDMGQNDINKGSDTNLFEVLSHRYRRSGMRRLFDADGKTQAEKPAQTDINQ